MRRESDLLGVKEVPGDAYWGIHTLRALENFRFPGPATAPELIRALAMVKRACCQANHELGYLPDDKAAAIERACEEIAGGGLSDQFPIPALQGGAGTSTNMNVNEVIANRALERLGRSKGDYAVIHPIEHVNLHQSTNDTYPTALKIACIFGLRIVSSECAALQGVFQRKEKEFSGIVKMGRTELQDAVPMTLGAEFSAFAEAVSRDRWRTFKCEERLRTINLGGTAIGTGLTAPRDYIFLVTEKIRTLTGLGLSRAENLVDATANADTFAETAGMLTAAACTLIKICRDLRLLHYWGEIALPAVQAGSSIMPGKVNPVILEVVISAGMRVQANSLLVTGAVASGTLQINEFLPLIGQALLESLGLLAGGAAALARHVEQIRADAEQCGRLVRESPMLVTALIPRIGYERATELVLEYRAGDHEHFQDFLENKLGQETVREALSSSRLTGLGYKPSA